MSVTDEEIKSRELSGSFVPAESNSAAAFIKESDIVGFDRLNVYDYFMNEILDNHRKVKRDLMLSAVGKYEKVLKTADAVIVSLNSVCGTESGLFVPAYNGYPAIIRFAIPDEEQQKYKELQLIDEADNVSIIVMGDDHKLKRLVFSKRLTLKNGTLNRVDNFTADGKISFVARLFEIITPEKIISDVRAGIIDKQNIINAALRAAIMSYVPESLSIRAVETTLLNQWSVMDESIKDILFEQYGKDVYKSLKKTDSIHVSESKCLGDIISVLRVKLSNAYDLLKAAEKQN